MMMTNTTDLRATVEMPVVTDADIHVEHYTEIELAILGYLADRESSEEAIDIDIADLLDCDDSRVTRQDLPAIEDIIDSVCS